MISRLSRLRRVPVVAWVALFVAVIAAVTALLGGFERHSGRWLGPEMALGETVDTRFWDVTVLEGRVNPIGPWVELEVEITNKTSEGTSFLTSHMLTGHVGDPATWLDPTYCRMSGDRPFNPGVTVSATCHFDPVDDATLDIEGLESVPMTISVLDQRMHQELLSGQAPIISSPAGQFNFEATVIQR